MKTIRESFQIAIDAERAFIDRTRRDRIRHIEETEDGRRTDVTDEMIAVSQSTIDMYESALLLLGDKAD